MPPRCYCYACELDRWRKRKPARMRRGLDPEPRPRKSVAEALNGCTCHRCRVERQRATKRKNKVLVWIVGELLRVVERGGLQVDRTVWRKIKAHGVRRRVSGGVTPNDKTR